MLRMGRSQKAEQSGQDKIEAERTSPQYGGNNPAPNSPAYQYGTDTPGVINQARPLGDKPATQRAMSESESLARDIKDGLVSGFVGTGTTLTGEANFKGMLRIDGHLSGHVGSEKGTLIISSGGQVDANIEVAAAKINGIVNGDIIATERIELGRTAHVYGNIQTPILVVEQGAIFEGSCRMARAVPAPAESDEALIISHAPAGDLRSAGTDEPVSATDSPLLVNAAR